MVVGVVVVVVVDVVVVVVVVKESEATVEEGVAGLLRLPADESLTAKTTSPTVISPSRPMSTPTLHFEVEGVDMGGSDVEGSGYSDALGVLSIKGAVLTRMQRTEI